MPELVEVEAARHLCEKVLGKKVSRAWIKPDEHKVITFPCTELASDIAGLQVEKGKVEAWLFVHLGMAGSVVVEGEKQLAYKSFTIDADEWPPRHAKIELEFDGGARWAFCDMRRFGKVFLSDTDAPFAELAPDGLLELPDEQAWVAALQKQKICLKALLLDQKRLVCGVGNWIADEVLYQAKLHPDLPSNSLSPEASLELRRCLKHVLEEGCRRNGETFPEHWLFNYRWGKASSQVQTDFHGNLIVHITSGGRTSAVVPKVQGDAPTSSKGAPRKSSKGAAATTPKGAPGKSSKAAPAPGKAGASASGKAAKVKAGGGKRNGKTGNKGKASADPGPSPEKGGGSSSSSRKRKEAPEGEEGGEGTKAAASKGKGAAASSKAAPKAARKGAAASAASAGKDSRAASSGGAKGAAKGTKAVSNARTTRSRAGTK